MLGQASSDALLTVEDGGSSVTGERGAGVSLMPVTDVSLMPVTDVSLMPVRGGTVPVLKMCLCERCKNKRSGLPPCL